MNRSAPALCQDEKAALPRAGLISVRSFKIIFHSQAKDPLKLIYQIALSGNCLVGSLLIKTQKHKVKSELKEKDISMCSESNEIFYTVCRITGAWSANAFVRRLAHSTIA